MSRIERLTGGPEAMLECCRACASRLAQPVRWRRLEIDVWQIDLRCPDCRHVWRERVPTEAVRRLDRILQESRAQLERILREIERIEHEQQIDSFTAALEAGRISPDDFAPPSASAA